MLTKNQIKLIHSLRQKKFRISQKMFIVEGVKTTIPFHLKLMSNKAYLSGKYTTKFMETFSMEN